MFLGFNDGDHKENALPWELYNRAAVICQVESVEGAKHADEICQVEGGTSSQNLSYKAASRSEIKLTGERRT